MKFQKIVSSSTVVSALLAAFFILSAAGLHADVIHFKDGRILEGKVIKEGKTEIEFKTKFGTVTIERTRIERIEIKESPDEAFKKRVDALDKSDAEAVFELAMWCKEQGMKKDYRKYLQETLKADKQHDGANEELGNIKEDGKWFSAKELEGYKKDKGERMKAQGWVLYDGEWMPEAEAKKLMGYVEHEGEWISQLEYYHIQGEQDIEKTFGYSMTITDSTHFTLRSSETEEHHNQLLDYCELEYEHFIRTFKPNPTEHRMIAYYPIPIYILDDIDDCVTFVESDYIKRYNPPKEDVESRRAETNFSIYFPRPLVVLSEGKHLVGADDRMTSQIGFMAHHIGHILIRRFKRGGKVPGWVEAGVAHYYEGMTNFHQTVSVCEFRGFDEVKKWVDDWGNFMQWKKKMVEKENLGPPLPTIPQLFELKIETMDSLHMAKSWSVTTYLIKNYREKFVEFARRSYAPFRGEKELSQAQAWKVAFPDISPEQMEEKWRAWIVEQPIAPSREDRLKLD